MSKRGGKMSITKRQEQILALLEEQGFASVERLSELMYTSPSSIRRDLTRLQNLYLIRRTHGGASIFKELNHAVPLNSRMEKNIVEKRKIAKNASVLLRDGQTVMLDGSTTAGFMVPHIAKHKDMVLFTNNMQTAINAVNYGIKTHCIGGTSVNRSVVLAGEQAYSTVVNIYPDILFFSSQCIDREGYIYDPILEENHIRELMLKNAACSVFLCDAEKFGQRSLYRLTSVDDIDVCVFDRQISELHTKTKIIY
ncbi:MAG: DeoR/GlpR transcriptional regulator [Ruminococcaceae bacterium]|nr:DeoR/GlpR transcriptional regulator [Oscillospiraceae bacterium]